MTPGVSTGLLVYLPGLPSSNKRSTSINFNDFHPSRMCSQERVIDSTDEVDQGPMVVYRFYRRGRSRTHGRLQILQTRQIIKDPWSSIDSTDEVYQGPMVVFRFYRRGRSRTHGRLQILLTRQIKDPWSSIDSTDEVDQGPMVIYRFY